VDGYVAAYDSTRIIARKKTADELHDDLRGDGDDDSTTSAITLSDATAVEEVQTETLPTSATKMVSAPPTKGDWVYRVTVEEVLRLSQYRMVSAATQRRQYIVEARRREMERLNAARKVMPPPEAAALLAFLTHLGVASAAVVAIVCKRRGTRPP
jgi:hypothetical protein